MKTILKRAAVIIVVLAILIAVVPYQWGIVMKDGGSRTWKSLTWEIHHYNKLKTVGEGDDGWFVGWRIKIFGYTLRDDYANSGR